MSESQRQGATLLSCGKAIDDLFTTSVRTSRKEFKTRRPIADLIDYGVRERCFVV